MKLNLRYFTFSGLLLLLIFSACRKESEMLVEPLITEWVPRVEKITGSLQGLIVDQYNGTISDALVTLNGNTTTTNDYGHFFFTNTEMNSKGTYVTIEKEGFFNGSRRFYPQADSKNRVKIEMLRQDFTTEFDATTGGSYVFSDSGVQLVFPPNTIKTESTDMPYEGIVFVAAQYLNPDDSNVFDQMPGNLQGINTSYEEGALKTLGMMVVELQGASGEKLNIVEGKTATVSIPVPTNIDNLPAEVPLWYFDEEIGLWIEEGTASLENGVYTGEVSHFSFWNWDIYAPSADLIAILTDIEGNPAQGITVIITSNSMGTAYGYTDEAGIVGGIIPANEVLTITLNSECSALLFTQEIGPFAEGTETTENITANITAINPITISGTVTDCDGIAITNSMVIVDYYYNPKQYIYTDENGAFNSPLVACMFPAPFANLRAVDLNNLVYSAPIALTTIEDNAVGAIITCDTPIAENTMTIAINGVTKTYLAEMHYNGGDEVVISSVFNSSYIDIVMSFLGAAIGSYDGTQNYSGNLVDPSLNWYYQDDIIFGGYENFNVSVFTDDKLFGNFSGELTNFVDGGNVFVEGTFNINPD